MRITGRAAKTTLPNQGNQNLSGKPQASLLGDFAMYNMKAPTINL